VTEVGGTVRCARLALKFIMQNDGDFLDVILPCLTLECAPRYSVGVLNRLRVVPGC
jgi:hypothetical protein